MTWEKHSLDSWKKQFTDVAANKTVDKFSRPTLSQFMFRQILLNSLI